MRLTGNQTVFPCEEHGVVSVSLDLLMTNGMLDVYPDVAGHGYFDIDYRRGELVLKASKYVGLIPISDRVAIHVRPKAPIGNLLWLAWRAGNSLSALAGVIRGYATGERGKTHDPESLYVDVFVRALEQIADRQVLKRYQSEQTDLGIRGRLNISPTIARYHARGLLYRHVVTRTEITVDNLENRIIKATAMRLVRHLRQDAGGEGIRLARRITALLEPLSVVQHDAVDPLVIANEVPRLLRRLPASAAHYESALWLAYLIATRSGVVMEQVGNARFESVLMNVSDIFESYVRTVCIEAEESIFHCSVRDGNQNPVQLFASGGDWPTKPDIQFLSQRKTLLLLDAKYKPSPSREDRYELISHCEAAEAFRAGFVCPRFAGQAASAHYGTTRRGVRMDLLRFDLAADDMVREERLFVENVAALLARDGGRPSPM